jgi:hypothetical protein
VNRDAGANAPSCSGGAGLGDAGLACTPGVLFPWGICACNEITSSYPITTDSFNSLDGGYGVEAGLGGGVGVNGELTTSSTFNVGGSLWVGATSGLARSANGDAVGLELHSNGPLQGTGTFGVGLNAYVNGDVAGAVTVGGTLDVPESASVASNVTAQSVVRGPVAVPSPCACDPSHLLDIQGLVEAAEQSNDDAAIGLAPDTLANVVGGARLDLPCGKYYLAGIGGPGPIAIAVHGRTSVFVLGDVIVSGAIEVTIDPQATLDLFISENLQGSGQLKLGSTAVPSQSRIYVGGSTVGLSNVDSVFAGNLYAPLASFGHSAATAVYGSLFVGGYAASGSLTVHYDSAILAAGNECGGAGAPPSCKTCEDCGNQACVGGKCGSCTTSADCCAPLLCQNGSCVQTPAPK